MCAPPPPPLLQHRLPSLARRPSRPGRTRPTSRGGETLPPREGERSGREKERTTGRPFSACLSVPENSEVAVDMRAQLERKYGITPQSSALGPAALGGVPDKLRQAAAPREGVALRKDLC